MDTTQPIHAQVAILGQLLFGFISRASDLSYDNLPPVVCFSVSMASGSCHGRSPTQPRIRAQPRCAHEKLEILGKLGKQSRAVAQSLGWRSDAIQHRKEKIRHRRLTFELDVTPALNRPATTTREQDGQVVVVVPVAIAQAGAIDDHAVVEQAPLPFLDRFQLVDEVGELRRVEPVYLRDLPLLLFVAAVVDRKSVV